MFNPEIMRETLRNTEQALHGYRKLTEEQAHFFLFPFTIQGCVNVTEAGIKPEALDINDYTYFSKEITGNHPIVAT